MEAVPAAATYRIHRYPSALIDRIVLADGRSVTVRPVLPQDAEAEQAFVSTLSLAARRRRFHVALNGLPPSLLSEFTQIDYRSHVALVAEAGVDEDDLRIVADARYVRSDSEAGEFAVVVADAWQGAGLGGELMRRLGRHARRHGVRRLYGDVQAGNDAMLALVRKLGGRLESVAGDASLVRACFSLR